MKIIQTDTATPAVLRLCVRKLRCNTLYSTVLCDHRRNLVQRHLLEIDALSANSTVRLVAPRAHIVVSARVLALHAVRRARVVAVLAPPARVRSALDPARLPFRRAHRDAAGPVGTLAVACCGRSVW